MAHNYQAPIKQTRTERNFWKRWDRRCGKTLSIQHDTAARDTALRRGVMRELREFAGRG
ncbi:hypothetical protein [Sporomusa aerivorans]|uniref:hypothetical protein n=1 Tax=Sporomusa aerivorans TaxID=204936 RepID=UPI00352BB3AE